MIEAQESKRFSHQLDDIANEVSSKPMAWSINAPANARREVVYRRLLARLDKPVGVVVKPGLDQVERTLFEIATPLGTETVRQVDATLRAGATPEAVSAATSILRQALGDRPLVVEGWENLRARAGDWALGNAMTAATEQLTEWLSDAARLRIGLGLARSAHLLSAPTVDEPDLTLDPRSDAMWENCAGDIDQYALGLSWLSTRDSDPSQAPLAEPELRRDIIQGMSENAFRLLVLLAAHDSDLPDKLLRILLGQTDQRSATEELLRLGMAWRSPSGLRLANLWSSWWHLQSSTRKTKPFAKLAEAYQATLDADGYDAQALSVLHTFRHHLQAGHEQQALAFARHSPALLVAHARQMSLASESPDAYSRAASLYHQILTADDDHRLHLTPRVRGYVRHYLHYNRAKASLESLESTEQGYQHAVQDWTQNALFWSRLIRTQVYQRRPLEARDTFERAEREVPEHPAKYDVLLARTVRGLLHRTPPFVAEAVDLWRDFTPSTAQTRSAESLLEDHLKAGWDTRQLTVSDQPSVVFRRAQHVVVLRTARAWQARLESQGLVATGASPHTALLALGARVRLEADTLIQAYTHQLDPVRIFKKQQLLGAIDSLASHLGGVPSDSTWVAGVLVRKDDALWLRAKGNHDAWYEVPPSLHPTEVNNLPRLARVKCATTGLPTGPVLALDEPFEGDEDELWRAWQARFRHAG